MGKQDCGNFPALHIYPMVALTCLQLAHTMIALGRASV